MRDAVVMPGDTYKVYLKNDQTLRHAEVLSVDEAWIEFAVLQSDGTYVFEVYSKDMIKKLQSSEDDDKKVWVLVNNDDEAKFTERHLSSDEIVMSRARNNIVILDSRDDAVEYIKDLKDKECKEDKLYRVQTQAGFGYESL